MSGTTTRPPTGIMQSTPGILVTVHDGGRRTEDQALFVRPPDETPPAVITVRCLRDCATES
jgi:hypothetical protein